jgi:DNA-binding transcriptional LysR family regulator
MRGSSLVSVLNAAISGLGLAVVPCHLGAGEPSLRCVPGDSIARHDVFIVVHPDLAKVARIRAVMDFFADVIGRDTALLGG